MMLCLMLLPENRLIIKIDDVANRLETKIDFIKTDLTTKIETLSSTVDEKLKAKASIEDVAELNKKYLKLKRIITIQSKLWIKFSRKYYLIVYLFLAYLFVLTKIY